MRELETSQISLLQLFLADRDEPCPLCNYNLRDLTGDHCPECGKRLVLRVGLEDPAIRLYLISVVALAVGAGFSALMLAFFFILSSRMGSVPWPYVATTLVGTIVFTPLLVMSLVLGRRIRRWSGRWRVILAVWSWIAVGVEFAFFVAAGFVMG